MGRACSIVPQPRTPQTSVAGKAIAHTLDVPAIEGIDVHKNDVFGVAHDQSPRGR